MFSSTVFFRLLLRKPENGKFRSQKSKRTKESSEVNDLVELRNDQVVVSSRKVAENFGKRHDRVLEAIRETLGGLPKNGDTHELFEKQEYTHPHNRKFDFDFYVL